MSKDYQSALNNLKRKIEIIISKYEHVSSDNTRLSKELLETKNALDLSNNKVKELELKISNLQLAEAFKTSSSDVREAKQKVGKIIKEIDKCIALLND
ncbi:MAG: hypothetical protein BGO30_04615 [Bacteroidetes bacterium 41-46]|jgi:methyl-accepting chemotaxis protein|nr:MAG: hypothetical protein BGO30_04615 [Bacteroidetes bacterium 41-46]